MLLCCDLDLDTHAVEIRYLFLPKRPRVTVKNNEVAIILFIINI